MSYQIRIESGTLSLEPAINAEQSAQIVALALGWYPSADGGYLGHSAAHDCYDSIRDLRTVLELLHAANVTVSGTLAWVGEDETRGTVTVDGVNATIEEPPDEDLAPSELKRIVDQLSNDTEELRLKAIEIILAFNLTQPEVLAALTYSLSDPSVQVRMKVAEALGLLGSVAAASVPALEAALPDHHIWVQAAAAEALGNLGAQAASAIPALRVLQQSPDYGPRGRALEAITKIAQARPSAQ